LTKICIDGNRRIILNRLALTRLSHIWCVRRIM